MKTYYFNEFYIPDHMMESLEMYIYHGIYPGSFLTAVLQNDLVNACGRADETNLRNLPAYAAYLYNNAPSVCWGSKERVEKWIEYKNKETK